MRWMRTALALSTAALAACGSDSGGTGMPSNEDATVQGRVEETTATPTPAAFDAMGAAGTASASAVAVGEVDSGGSFHALAEGSVEADGSFSVEGVPAGRENLVVMAKDETGADVGQVILHERTEAGMTATAAPITPGTTLRARTWARIQADGNASSTSAEEVELLIHPGASASASIITSGEVDVAAQGLATAGEAMTKAYAGLGTSLDASTRASLMASAAIEYAMARYQGATVQAAASDYMSATLDAFVGAGADLESTAAATAAAASTFDAQLHGRSTARGQLISDAVVLNLKARERLAAQYEGSAEGSIAVMIRDALASTETQVWSSASSAADVRAALDAGAQATTQATVGAMVDMLVPDAGALVRSDVQAKANAAVQAARMDARLSGAANADAAAQAVANYRSAVHAAVQAMLEAAGRTDLNVDTMTSLYIAAHGGAFVRAS